MPLAVPLATLCRDLEEQLTDDLAGALKTLRDLLPERSEKHTTVVGLVGRLNDANKARLRNTLSNEALQREYDTLRANLLDLLAELTEADFEATIAPPHASGKPGAKQGSVLYRIPHQMPMRRETKCVVRIALDEDVIVEDIQLDEHVVLKALRRVSDLMQVELADPSAAGVFRIRSTSELQQLVLDDGYTEWFFYVEPLQEGSWPLEIKVAVIELALGKECKREYVLSETVQIVTDLPAAVDTETPLKHAGYTLPFQPPGEDILPAKGRGIFNDTAGSAAPGGLVDWAALPPATPQTAMPLPPPMAEAPPLQQPARQSNRGLRSLAVFLAFLVVGAGGTWAATPVATRDWWVTRYVENTPEAYAAYMTKHPQSPYLESAAFRKALTGNQAASFRDYVQAYPRGQFREAAVNKYNELEINHLAALRTNPTAPAVRQFLVDFPASDRLAEVKQVVESHPQLRAELLPALENAYVEALRQDPSPVTVRRFLTDFPASERLTEVKEVVDTRPELRPLVQADLEDAFLKRIEQDPTAAQVAAFKRNFPQPVQQEKLERIVLEATRNEREKPPANNRIREANERRLINRPAQRDGL